VKSLGAVGLPIVIVDHPLGGERPDAIARRAEQALDQLTSLAGGRR
jgi:hypothetical protein